jgi:hypothetical protein
MASYNVNSGDTLTIDETLAGTIDYININDGVCNIVNASNTGLVLEFESSGYISVKAFGQLNVRGSMIELGTSDGSRGFSVPHWQSTHAVNVIWVETSVGSDKYQPWYGINTPGSTLLSMSDFPDNLVSGRVFEWNDGTIEFSPNEGEAAVPGDGCKIKAPNIIFSTVDPFGSTTTAKIQYDEGGFVSIKDSSFSDFSATLKGMAHVDIERVGFYGSAYIQYCNDFNLKDVHAGIKDNYSTGMSFSYSSNGVVENISGMSTKSKGVTFNYLKNIHADNITGIVAKRDSASDNAIFMTTVQGSEISNTTGIGGATKLSNVSESRVVGVVTIDSTKFEENSSRSTSNLDIDSSSNVVIRDWTVPTGGGAKLSYLKIKNSPNIDIVKTNIQSGYATNVVSGDVSFGTRISEMFYEGFTGSVPFFMPAKNNGVLLQHITCPSRAELSIEASNTLIKGADAASVKTDNPGTAGSNFAQLYTSDTEGQLVFVMAKDSVETSFFKSMLGGVKFSNNGRAYFTGAGDTVEFITPYRVKGVSLQDVDPIIEGYGLDAIALDYAIDLGNGFSTYRALNGENLSAEPIIPEDGFLMKIRAVSGTVSGTTYVSAVKLPTLDSRYVYPLDFEVGRIVFDDNAVIDDNAMFFAYYTDGYGTVDAVMVRDADGQPVTGRVDGREFVDFTYDFTGDESNGRVADEPFGITVVLAGTNMAQNIVIDQVFDKGQLNVFSLRPDKEYAYLGV